MTLAELGEPRYQHSQALQLVGLSEEYTEERTVEIPKQWDRFTAALDQTVYSGPTFGVVYRAKPMRYVCGVEGAKLDLVPNGWLGVEVPAQHYAMFSYEGRVNTIRRAWGGLSKNWMPLHANELSDGPMIEFYDARFAVGKDYFEIWLPMKA